MRVRYTRRARADLESIYVYTDERSPNAARAVRSTIQEAIDRIADHPYIGRPSNRQADVRVLSIVRYPYIVFYRIVRAPTLGGER